MTTTSSLIFTGQLPLAWRELPTLPDETELRTIEHSNLAILHTLFALDIHSGDHSDDPSLLANASELKRLDFKVGLLLELVGQLFARQQAIPMEHPLTLTVNDLSWDADASPSPGALLQLEIYCNLSYPHPLILHAEVTDITVLGSKCNIKARLYQPSVPLQEALERYIFLQHRRLIANRRGNSQR
jgi:hypothetical protein